MKNHRNSTKIQEKNPYNNYHIVDSAAFNIQVNHHRTAHMLAFTQQYDIVCIQMYRSDISCEAHVHPSSGALSL